MQVKIAEVATSASYTLSAGTVIAGLTINEVAAIGGLVLAIATFAINWIYRHRHYQLAKSQSDNGGSSVDA